MIEVTLENHNPKYPNALPVLVDTVSLMPGATIKFDSSNFSFFQRWFASHEEGNGFKIIRQ